MITSPDSNETWITVPLRGLEHYVLRPIVDCVEREDDLRKGGILWTEPYDKLKEFMPLFACYLAFILLLGWDIKCYYSAQSVRCLLRSPLAYLIVGGIFVALTSQYLRALKMNIGAGRGWPDSPTPPEPAYRNYFFHKAQKDYEFALRQALRANQKTTNHLVRIIRLLVANPVLPITWIPGLFVAVCLILGYVAALALYVGLGLLHLLIGLTCCAAIIAFAYTLRGLEYALMQWRRIRMVCPNSKCYRHIALPIYLCPKCQAQHACLIPGQYGIFYRRCKCKWRISTSALSGRSKLMSLCPHEGCRKPLPSGIEATRVVHITLVGGPNAGKTTLLTAITSELHRQADDRGFAIQIPQSRQANFFRVCESLLKSGHFPRTTVDMFPDAFVAYLEDVRGNRVALYIYDPMGEAFRRRDILRVQRFHSVTDSFLFLVDPMTVRRVVADREGDSIAPAGPDPQAVYDAFVGQLQESRGSDARFLEVALRVVITKEDLMNQARLDPRLWLAENGHDNLVRSIENDFKDVDYFWASAIPELEIQPRHAARSGVTEIADWVLSLTELDTQRILTNAS